MQVLPGGAEQFFCFFSEKNLKEWDFSGKLTGKRI